MLHFQCLQCDSDFSTAATLSFPVKTIQWLWTIWFVHLVGPCGPPLLWSLWSMWSIPMVPMVYFGPYGKSKHLKGRFKGMRWDNSVECSLKLSHTSIAASSQFTDRFWTIGDYKIYIYIYIYGIALERGPFWRQWKYRLTLPQRILASLNSLLNKQKCPFELQFSLHKCPKPSWQGFS